MAKTKSEPNRRLAAFLVMSVVIGLSVPLAPAAYADDDNDRAFILALKHNGVVAVPDNADGRARLVATAHWACDQLATDASRQTIVQWLMQYNGYVSPDGGVEAQLLREAAHYYCPEHQEKAGW